MPQKHGGYSTVRPALPSVSCLRTTTVASAVLWDSGMFRVGQHKVKFSHSDSGMMLIERPESAMEQHWGLLAAMRGGKDRAYYPSLVSEHKRRLEGHPVRGGTDRIPSCRHEMLHFSLAAC